MRSPSVVDLFVAGRWPAIRPACRGRAKGDGRVLSQAQEQAIQSLIIQNRPEQLKMDFCLWSRAAVGQLISQEYGIDLQVRSIGKYLTRWVLRRKSPSSARTSKSPRPCKPGLPA